MPAFHGWLQEAMNTEGKTLQFFVDGIAMGGDFSDIPLTFYDSPSASKTIYTLDGRKLTGQPRSGLYIINGKKVFVK